MSLKEMTDAVQLATKTAVERAQAQARAQLERLQKHTAELHELHDKLTAATDEGEIEELEEEAAELAEELKIYFIYKRNDGTKRTYTPEAFWEPSGGCEWVESAQYGYDYGWDI